MAVALALLIFAVVSGLFSTRSLGNIGEEGDVPLVLRCGRLYRLGDATSADRRHCQINEYVFAFVSL